MNRAALELVVRQPPRWAALDAPAPLILGDFRGRERFGQSGRHRHRGSCTRSDPGGGAAGPPRRAAGVWHAVPRSGRPWDLRATPADDLFSADRGLVLCAQLVAPV